jgi:hypothetical protein
VYYSKRGSLAYVNRSGSFAFALRGYARRDDYQQLNNLDFHERGGRIECGWLESGGARIAAYADYLRRNFLILDQVDTARTSGVAMTYSLTRNVSVTLEGARFGQSSTGQSSTASLNNFVDRRVMLVLAYSSGPLYTVQFRR